MTTETAGLAPGLHTTPAAEPVTFEALVDANQRVIYAVCLRLLRDRCAAEDACQETLLAAWRHRDDRCSLSRMWLIHVAVNKCRDELRRRKRRLPGLCLDHAEGQALASPEPDPESVAVSGDSCRAIERALMQLPFGQRVALVLADVEGWSYHEIAAATDVSVGTVKSRVFRGRMRLREVLGERSRVRGQGSGG